LAIIVREFIEVIKKRYQSRVGRKRLLNDSRFIITLTPFIPLSLEGEGEGY